MAPKKPRHNPPKANKNNRAAAKPKIWLQLIDSADSINWTTNPPAANENESTRAHKIFRVARILREMDGLTWAGMDTFNKVDATGAAMQDTEDMCIPLRSWAVNNGADVYARFETGVLARKGYQTSDMDLVLGVYYNILDGLPHIAFAGASMKDDPNYQDYHNWVNGKDTAQPGRTWGVHLANAAVDWANDQPLGQTTVKGASSKFGFLLPDLLRAAVVPPPPAPAPPSLPVMQRSQWVLEFEQYLTANATNVSTVRPTVPNGFVRYYGTITHKP